MPTTFPRLPPELLALILTSLHEAASPWDDVPRQTLCSCLLVSRAMCAMTKPLIFGEQTVYIEYEDWILMELEDLRECGLPVEGMPSSGFVQHIHSLNLVISLYDEFFGVVVDDRDFFEEAAAVINLFNTKDGRVRHLSITGHTLQSTRRLEWSWMRPNVRSALRKLVVQPQLKSLRFEHIKTVPSSFLKGTSLNNVFFDADIRNYMPRNLPTRLDDYGCRGSDDFLDNSEDPERYFEEPVPETPDVKAISTLPLSNITTLGVRIDTEKDYAQMMALLDRVAKSSSLHSLDLIFGAEFHTKRPLPWRRYPSLKTLTLVKDSDSPQRLHVLDSVLTCVKTVLELVRPERGEALPIPHLIFKLNCENNTRNGERKKAENPDGARELLSGDRFAMVKTIRIDASVGVVGIYDKQHPFGQWRSEVYDDVASLHLPGKEIHAYITFSRVNY